MDFASRTELEQAVNRRNNSLTWGSLREQPDPFLIEPPMCQHGSNRAASAA